MSLSRRSTFSLLAASAVVALAAGCTTVTSNTALMQARLSGDAQVPPVQTMGQGVAQVWLNKDTGGLRWKVDYSGLSGPATAAHFHGPADVASNGPVVVPFKSPLTYPTIEGEATITPAQVQDLLAGRWYINIHTAKNPGGEIRGQVVLQR